MHNHTPPSGKHRVAASPPDIAFEWVNPSAHGPILVWIHGLGASSTSMFAPVAGRPALTGAPSLLLDLPGHGQSGKPKDWPYDIASHAVALNGAIARLCPEPVILMGHSLGGSVAIEIARTFPSRIVGVIAAEPTLDPAGGPISARICRQSEDAFVATGYDALVAATERLAGQGSRSAADWLPSLKIALPEALHRSATSVRSQRSPTFRAILPTLPMPVAVIEGEHSASVIEPPTAAFREDDGSPAERLQQLKPEPPPADALCAEIPRSARNDDQTRSIRDRPLRSDGSAGSADSQPELRGYVVPGAGHHIASDNPDGFAATLAEIVDLHRTRG